MGMGSKKWRAQEFTNNNVTEKYINRGEPDNNLASKQTRSFSREPIFVATKKLFTFQS